MAAPSISRRSRQRQGIVSLRAKRAAALILSKPPQFHKGVSIGC